MSQQFVDYTQVSINNIIFKAPQTKDSKGPQAVSYKEIEIKYNFGTAEAPINDKFLIQLPELTTRQGIVESVQPLQNKKTYSVPTTFNLSDKNNSDAISLFDTIYNECVKYVAPIKGSIGMPKFKQEDPEPLFSKPLYYPTDKMTGNLIPGRNPSMYIKCKYYIYKEKEIKAMFTDLSGKAIDWRRLKDVEMSFIPVIHISNLFIGGGRIRLMMKLESAIVTNIVKAKVVSIQMSTIDRLIKQRPDLLQKLNKQLEDLEKEEMTKDMSNNGELTSDNLDGFLDQQM